MKGFDIVQKYKSKDFSDVAKFFTGIFPRDEIPRHLDEGHFIIANVDPKSKKGSHWFFLTNHNGNYECFDPLGTTEDFLKLIYPKKKVTFNVKPVQPQHSAKCGEFCVYWSVLRTLNYDLSFENTLKYYFFTDKVNLDHNEEIVETFWKTGHFEHKDVSKQI